MKYNSTGKTDSKGREIITFDHCKNDEFALNDDGSIELIELDNLHDELLKRGYKNKSFIHFPCGKRTVVSRTHCIPYHTKENTIERGILAVQYAILTHHTKCENIDCLQRNIYELSQLAVTAVMYADKDNMTERYQEVMNIEYIW